MVEMTGRGVFQSFPNTLGLKFVQTLVESQLSGSVSMESQQGTVFTIVFET